MVCSLWHASDRARREAGAAPMRWQACDQELELAIALRVLSAGRQSTATW